MRKLLFGAKQVVYIGILGFFLDAIHLILKCGSKQFDQLFTSSFQNKVNSIFLVFLYRSAVSMLPKLIK